LLPTTRDIPIPEMTHAGSEKQHTRFGTSAWIAAAIVAAGFKAAALYMPVFADAVAEQAMPNLDSPRAVGPAWTPPIESPTPVERESTETVPVEFADSATEPEDEVSEITETELLERMQEAAVWFVTSA
jgi:hypothetical protein